MKKPSRSDLLGALARGYAIDRNKNKVLDPDLVEDMADEVQKLLDPHEGTAAEQAAKVRAAARRGFFSAGE